MRATPADRQVIDELTPTPADLVLTKWRYSAFHRTDCSTGSGRPGGTS